MSKNYHYDYVYPIIEWAEQKGILRNGRLTKQLMKSSEECLELQTALESYANGNKEALEDIKDAIGDVYVTLVIATRMITPKTYLMFRLIKPSVRPKLDYNYLNYIIGLKELDKEILEEFITEEEFRTKVDLKLARYVEYLNIIAIDHGLTLIECIKLAYNTISKRKGEMIDGSFVKDE